VADAGNDEDRDATELGVLLELLSRRGDAFATVRATYRIWRHQERLTAAFLAHIEEQRRQGASIATVSAQRTGPPAPAEHEEVLRVWRDGDRIRQEHDSDDWRDGAYAVRDGDLWWSWNSHIGALSNQDDPTVGGNHGQELAVMLDPTPLLGA
jgi:hypothetical protein